MQKKFYFKFLPHFSHCTDASRDSKDAIKKVQNTDAKSEIFQSRGGFVELFRVGEVSWN